MPPNDLIVELVPIEPLASEIPALLHRLFETRARSLLLGRQNAFPPCRHDPGDRAAVAGNQVFLAGRDLIDQGFEASLGFLDADRPAHAVECSTQCATFKTTVKRAISRRVRAPL